MSKHQSSKDADGSYKTPERLWRFRQSLPIDMDFSDSTLTTHSTPSKYETSDMPISISSGEDSTIADSESLRIDLRKKLLELNGVTTMLSMGAVFYILLFSFKRGLTLEVGLPFFLGLALISWGLSED